jgi:hypothetical protein
MSLVIPRRGFIAGLVGLVAAPAVVRASSLMPVKMPPVYKLSRTFTHNGQVMEETIHSFWHEDARRLLSAVTRQIGPVDLGFLSRDAGTHEYVVTTGVLRPYETTPRAYWDGRTGQVVLGGEAPEYVRS